MHEVNKNSSELLSGLNEPQIRAINHKEGPAVLFAGAGSGKTKVIIHRMLKLILDGTKPYKILAVTFTNKAANEMRERYSALAPGQAFPHIATFHGACVRWLREFAPRLGFTAHFTILSDRESQQLLKMVMLEQKIDLKQTTPAMIKSMIGSYKMNGITPPDIRNLPDYWQVPDSMEEIYKGYQSSLAANNAMDFSDLLLNMVLLLRNNNDVLQMMQRRYDFLMIDEFQDTNHIQAELAGYLINKDQNIFVVGDDDQAIYGWRGADPGTILKFSENFPETKVIKLEQNYRSTSNIVDAAASMIAHNKVRAEKKLWTNNPAGDLIEFKQVRDGHCEAATIIDSIISESETYELENTAVFYRTNAQSRLIEEALIKERIPYTIYGSVRFYERMEIKDFIAYIRVAFNLQDNLALRRIINVPARAIGKKTVEDLECWSSENNVSLWQGVKHFSKIPGRNKDKLSKFITTIETFSAQLQAKKTSEAMTYLIESIDYQSYIEKKFPDSIKERRESIDELRTGLCDFFTENPDSTIGHWLQEIALLSSDKEQGRGVVLMTLHAAKGLEFDRVYLTGVDDGLLPLVRPYDDGDVDVEEERRLFYVGITRARKKITFIHSEVRFTFQGAIAYTPSRFLNEIPKKYFSPLAEGEKIVNSGLNEDTDQVELLVGSMVHHLTYGKGQIRSIDEFAIKPRAVVEFMEWGPRSVNMSQLDPLESHISYDFD